jgi:Flp pilus assembly protein TadD
VYGSDVLRDFIEVMATGRRWRAVLDKWDVQTVLVQRDAVLAQALHTAGGWRPVFAEREAVVFVREGARNQAVLAGLAAVDLAPPTPEAVSAIADAMRAIQVGDQAGAIRRLEAALAADPEHPVALFSLAVIREERGEAAVARALLERVVRSERGGPLAQQAQDRLKRLEGGAGR